MHKADSRGDSPGPQDQRDLQVVGIPLFFLENDKGLQQDSVRCILRQSALQLEQIISDYPGIAIEFATLSARYNCLPVTGAQFFLAKLFDNTFSKALLAYSNRQNFKHLSELVAEKPSKRASLLTQLVSKEHTAQVFIERILKHNEHWVELHTRTRGLGGSIPLLSPISGHSGYHYVSKTLLGR